LINRLATWRELAERCFDIFPYSMVFGTGVAHPSFWSSRPGWKDTLNEWKPVLEKCYYVGVHGPLSAQLLTDAGVANVEVIGDPVLRFAADVAPGDGSYMPDTIGLNIAQVNGCMWGSQELVFAECVKLATFARKAGWAVKWFVVYPKDLRITEEAAQLSMTDNEIYKVYSDASNYLELVKPLSAFVGMKLHAVALATVAYVPSVMLEYRPKCRDYMQSIGHDHMTIRTDRVRAEQIWEIVSTLNSRRQAAAKALYDVIKPFSEAQQAKANQLTETMVKG